MDRRNRVGNSRSNTFFFVGGIGGICSYSMSYCLGCCKWISALQRLSHSLTKNRQLCPTIYIYIYILTSFLSRSSNNPQSGSSFNLNNLKVNSTTLNLENNKIKHLLILSRYLRSPNEHEGVFCTPHLVKTKKVTYSKLAIF